MNSRLKFFLYYQPGLLFCLTLVFLTAGGVHANRQASPAGPAAAEMQSLSGRGGHFEVILKFPPLALGSEATLTAYVLDGATNEPVQGATVSGGMSSGTESITVPFTETARTLAGAVAGAYQGEIRVASDEASSWLFDISLGEKSDLVAIDGFKAGQSSGPAAPAPQADEESGSGIRLTPAEIALLLAAFAVLQVAIFIFIRKRNTSGGSAKESR